MLHHYLLLNIKKPDGEIHPGRNLVSFRFDRSSVVIHLSASLHAQLTFCNGYTKSNAIETPSEPVTDPALAPTTTQPVSLCNEFKYTLSSRNGGDVDITEKQTTRMLSISCFNSKQSSKSPNANRNRR